MINKISLKKCGKSFLNVIRDYITLPLCSNERIKSNRFGCVPDQARCSRYEGEEFLFHRFNPRTRTCTQTRATLCGVRIYKGPRRFSFRGYSPFFKLGKKKKKAPVLSGPPYQITPPPFHLFILCARPVAS